MNTYTIEELLSPNPYAGRGIIIGKTDAKAIFAYFIMGRSENSRNRVFIKNNDDIVINAFEPAKLSDPSLVIYSPVRVLDNKIIVTNGDQTDTIYDYIKKSSTFEDALRSRCFEPDPPNFTPRISGIIEFCANEFTYKLSILKSQAQMGTVCDRFFYEYAPVDNIAHFIHTYKTDGNPIPSFEGEPERLHISGNVENIAEQIWNNLNEDNKVSLVVRSIDLNTKEVDEVLINKNK